MKRQKDPSRASIASTYIKEHGIADGLMSAALANAVSRQALPRCSWFLHEPKAPGNVTSAVLTSIREGKL